MVNDTTRLRAKCKEQSCNWILYARTQNYDNRIVRINTLVDKHACDIVFDNKHVTSPWLANYFLEYFRLNPNMNYKCFKEMAASSKFSNVSKAIFYYKQLITTNPSITSLLKLL